MLHEAVSWLPPNDHGRPWPQPRRETILDALVEHRELWPVARNVAMEAKATALDQGRAPNIAGLFAKKLAARADVRKRLRASLRDADELRSTTDSPPIATPGGGR